MDIVVFLGFVAAVGAFIAGILAFTNDDLDEAIKDAQNWDSKQKRIAQALERK